MIATRRSVYRPKLTRRLIGRPPLRVALRRAAFADIPERRLGLGTRGLVILIVCAFGAACGKKGPPQPPIVRVPSAVQQIAARRVGHDVYVTLTVPATNIDTTMPADVARIEIYGYTGVTPPPRGVLPTIGSRIGTISVQPPPRPGGAPANGPGSTPPAGVAQGSITTLRDELTQEELVAPPEPAPPPGSTPTPVAGPLRRFYTAVPFSPRGRAGPPGAVAELALSPLPAPPRHPQVTYTADTLTLTWAPSGGLIGFLFERPLAFEPSPVDDEQASADATTQSTPDGPSGPVRYNVYREIAADPLVLPSTNANVAETPPAPEPPVNPFPLTALTYVEDLTLDERERCYTVRAVRGIDPDVVEGDASTPLCITPIDVFAPVAPVGVSAIGAEGVISLIWEPNTEPDLAGYLVLRGEPGSDTLAPLTDAPILETRYTDRQVKAGARYQYAVVAVDDRVPLPNVSEESLRVEGTAR